MNNKTKFYKFFDTDGSGMAEYNISGEDYKNLLRVCCKYSETFSLLNTNPDAAILKKLATFEVGKNAKISYKFPHYGTNYKIKYYRVCPKLLEVLVTNTNSIFSWINSCGFTNPEDPTFYRKDGSVFFTSTIHDGECTLAIKNEDVSEIISNKLWIAKAFKLESALNGYF